MSIHGLCLGVFLVNKEIFLNYVSNFDITNKNISRKVQHSLRVGTLCRQIAISLGLGNDLINVAEFIGLVHDIGRFTQWEEYNTFDDLKSIDHAILGIDILFNEGIINKFNIDNKWNNTIYNAIINHNNYKISKDVKGDDLVIAKILRDADKLDILYMVSKRDIVLDEDNSKVRKDIANRFFNYKELYHTLDMNKTEKVLLKLAFVYDINYKWSIDYLINERIIEKIYDNLIYKESIDMFYKYLLDYIRSFNGKI